MMHYKIHKHGIYSEAEGSYKFQWRDLIRWGLHLPVGGLIGYLIIEVDGFLGLTAALFFLAYEALEDYRVADRSFKDVFGALIAIIAVGLLFKII